MAPLFTLLSGVKHWRNPSRAHRARFRRRSVASASHRSTIQSRITHITHVLYPRVIKYVSRLHRVVNFQLGTPVFVDCIVSSCIHNTYVYNSPSRRHARVYRVSKLYVVYNLHYTLITFMQIPHFSVRPDQTVHVYSSYTLYVFIFIF